MTNLKKFIEVFGCIPFEIFGYCDKSIEAEIWEESEYEEQKIDTDEFI